MPAHRRLSSMNTLKYAVITHTWLLTAKKRAKRKGHPCRKSDMHATISQTLTKTLSSAVTAELLVSFLATRRNVASKPCNKSPVHGEGLLLANLSGPVLGCMGHDDSESRLVLDHFPSVTQWTLLSTRLRSQNFSQLLQTL